MKWLGSTPYVAFPMIAVGIVLLFFWSVLGVAFIAFGLVDLAVFAVRRPSSGDADSPPTA